MSFLATLQRLQQKCDRHEQVIDVEQRRADYRRVQTELMGLEENLRAVVAKVQLFLNGNLPLGEALPVLEALRDRLRELAGRWQADAAGVLRDGSLEAPLRELLDMLDTELDAAYEAVRGEWLGESLPAYYAPLTRSTPQKPLVDRLQSIDADLPRLLPEAAPTEVNRLQRARTLKAERDRLRAELDAAIPADVRAFFARIVRGEALLLDLTPELLQQLRELQADRLVRLTLR